MSSDQQITQIQAAIQSLTVSTAKTLDDLKEKIDTIAESVEILKKESEESPRKQAILAITERLDDIQESVNRIEDIIADDEIGGG